MARAQAEVLAEGVTMNNCSNPDCSICAEWRPSFTAQAREWPPRLSTALESRRTRVRKIDQVVKSIPLRVTEYGLPLVIYGAYEV